MNGTLEDTTPAGVLQVLSSQRKTGAVRFLGETGCTVYLHEGQLYFAESDETAEDLAVALVRPGRLSASEWDACTEAGYPDQTVGEALIETGSITRDLLASIVLSVIYDPLIQLFRAPEGDYEFAPDVIHWIGPFRTFGIDAIVAEVRRRTREADEMAPLVPSLDAEVRSARTLPTNRGSVNLRRDDWEVVVAAASGLTINDLAVELGRGRWSTARLVYRLASADLLMVTADEPAAAPTLEGPAPTESLTSPGGPPPLDIGAFSPEETEGADADPWALPAEPSADDPWNVETAATPDTADDAWATPETADDDWATPDTSFVETPQDDWATPDTPFAETPQDDWATPDTADDAWATPDTAFADAPQDNGIGLDDSPLSAVPDPDAPAADTEPPALHPDIAKALAESTYADSATAINAMAARLGAADGDDEDDWDTGAGESAESDSFWSDDSGTGTGENFDFIWEPAAWDTGVESTPLPQRAHTAREGDVAVEDRQPGAADPAWLNSLYTQFMPGEAGQDGAPPVAAPAADPGAEPKKRTLKRLMSAIKRL